MKFVLLVLFLFLVSCSEENPLSKIEFQEAEVPGVSFDIVLPNSLWEKIQQEAPAELKMNKSIYELFQSKEVEVKLVEGSGSVLNRKNFSIKLENFGGMIDLSNFVNSKSNGKLSVYFKEENYSKENSPVKTKVFYSSWMPTKDIDGELVGSGCSKVFDISNYYEKVISKNGLNLHTAQKRYLYSLIGRYYFVSFFKDRIQLSQITFTHKLNEDLFCTERI